jgi:hypothetical protein
VGKYGTIVKHVWPGGTDGPGHGIDSTREATGWSVRLYVTMGTKKRNSTMSTTAIPRAPEVLRLSFV